jgi:hypothetical protein
LKFLLFKFRRAIAFVQNCRIGHKRIGVPPGPAARVNVLHYVGRR